jgi:two-component system chemotaxis response regulator CheY
MDRSEARVLVVDDSEMTREVFRSTLYTMGFLHVDEAPDGEVALGKLASHHYDVVISDWQMPHMDGISLLKHIRATPGLEHLPVLIVTGEVTRQRVFDASEAGVSGFLTKPFFHQSLDEQLSIFVGPRLGQTVEAHR